MTVHAQQRHEILQISSRETEGVPDLVTELTVADDTQDVQVHIATLGSVCQQTETQRVDTAGRNSLREIIGLSFLGTSNLQNDNNNNKD